MMARRRRAALALVVGLMAGVANRGIAQAVSVSFAVVNDSISPAPQILVQGTPGPPSLGPYNVTLEAALEYIEEDEYVEVTPKIIRLRKIGLTEADSKRKNRSQRS